MLQLVQTIIETFYSDNNNFHSDFICIHAFHHEQKRYAPIKMERLEKQIFRADLHPSSFRHLRNCQCNKKLGYEKLVPSLLRIYFLALFVNFCSLCEREIRLEEKPRTRYRPWLWCCRHTEWYWRDTHVTEHWWLILRNECQFKSAKDWICFDNYSWWHPTR